MKKREGVNRVWGHFVLWCRLRKRWSREEVEMKHRTQYDSERDTRFEDL